jgi:transcriptional regulator with XRE-family HTH domain
VTNALGAYLKARRATVPPVEATEDSARRAAGMRAEEVARAAGISASYYRRLEQGRVAAPSYLVLARLADALLLDERGADYLARLAGLQDLFSPGPGAGERLESTLEAALAPWSRVPAAVQTRNFDVVLINPLLTQLTDNRVVPGSNFVELFFSVEGGRQTPDWEENARHNVAALRYYGDPADVRFREITGGLLVQDRDFRRLWAQHDAEPFDFGRSWFMTQDHGVFALNFRNLLIPSSGGHLLTAFTAEPGSAGERALSSLHLPASDGGVGSARIGRDSGLPG